MRFSARRNALHKAGRYASIMVTPTAITQTIHVCHDVNPRIALLNMSVQAKRKRMKQLIKLVVTTLLCAGAALTHAKAHNYDLPYICESGTNLTSLESTQKLTFETTVIPIAKQVMKEAGALAGSLGIGYAGRIILVCAIGYADWNSAELLAVAGHRRRSPGKLRHCDAPERKRSPGDHSPIL